MSRNLTLAFDRYGIKGAITCYERQRLDWQDCEAFDAIAAEAVPLPDGVMWYEDDGVAYRTEDMYGKTLTFMSSHTIARHLSGVTLGRYDAAVLAFLKALPPDTRVVLWWD